MKIDRNKRNPPSRFVKPSFTMRLSRGFTVLLISTLFATPVFSQGTAQQTNSAKSSQAANNASNLIAPPSFQNSIAPNLKTRAGLSPGGSSPPANSASSRKAAALIQQVLGRLAHGQSFDCEVRQRVRAAGGEALGVGTYLQVGRGTGQFSMHVSMHDGDGKYTLQQISDGRLAYTRTEIADRVSLIRVDVGSLDEGARVLGRRDAIKPSMLVGGPCEMLDTIRRDYDLRLGTSQLNGSPLLVIMGTLKPTVREEMKRLGGSMDRFPTQVNVMVAAENDPETNFGKGLPVRIEHRADAPQRRPKTEETGAPVKASAAAQGPLISLVEFYSFQPIKPPPIQRFRFENQDASVTFVNETSRYEKRFDIRVSAKERARYR